MLTGEMLQKICNPINLEKKWRKFAVIINPHIISPAIRKSGKKVYFYICFFYNSEIESYECVKYEVTKFNYINGQQIISKGKEFDNIFTVEYQKERK